ncbi:hypothetical protein KKC91_03350 [bacterium]|nr:hypothetical protein [bacterium]
MNIKPNQYIFFLILYIVLLALALAPYYINNTIILGMEGDYVLDFSAHLSKFTFMWFPVYGVGLQNMSPSGTGLNILLLCLIEKLTGSIPITNFVLIFSIYFFPFLAMYLVCKAIKATPFTSFAIALFYVFNPFVLYYLTCINQWNVFGVTVMPMFLWVILKYYHSNFKLFFFFGLISACFSFTYSNPPILVIIHISVVFSMVMVSYYRNKKFILLEILKKYSIVIVSFIAFNLWWILNLFVGAVATAKEIYSASWAHSWLNTTVSGHRPILARMFSITTMIGINPSWDFFTWWYSTMLARLITLVPIFMIIYFVLMVKSKKTRNSLNLAIFSTLLLVLFFVKGNASPFGFIYDLMFKHLPFFYIFKSPVEKFGLLYIFILSVLLLLIMNGIKAHKYYKPILCIFTVYLIVCSVPVLTGNIIPDYNLGSLGYGSRKYKDKNGYRQFRESVNKDNFQYRIFSLPGVGNYQVCLPNYNGKKYTGLDPVLMNTNKPFIAPYNGIGVLYNNISSAKYAKLLGIYNIGKIMINEDLIPWFGIMEKESIPELKTIFDKSMASKKWENITLYNNEDYFLPRIYTSGNSN